MKTIPLQNILLPTTNICAEEPLFFRRSNNSIFLHNHSTIHCDKGQLIHFNTYFNAISIAQWRKYTNIQGLALHLTIKGPCIVLIHRSEHYPHGLTTQLISQHHVETSTSREITLPPGDLPSTGLLHFSIQALNDGFEFHGGRWEGTFDETRDINLAIVFCTYKREQYMLQNLERLRDYDVFVVDNAGTLPEGCCEHLYRNRNLGGAGGFARGMYEVSKLPEYTHILLMDDDVIVHPESVFRTQTLFSVLKPEYQGHIIGGAMFMMDKPSCQVEAGTIIGDDMSITRLKYDLDMRKFENCVINDIEEHCDCNAWFFCALPAHHIKGDQLPPPVFYQFDDVEFGLRHRGKVIHLNGICVWHETYLSKLYNSRWYYTYRNQPISAALSGMDFSGKRFIRRATAEVFRHIICLRYNMAELILDGIDDFLRGADWLKTLDAEENHRAVMDKCYTWNAPDDLGIHINLDALEASKNTEDRGKLSRLKRLLTLNGLFLRPNKFTLTYTISARPIQFYRASGAAYYDPYTRKAFITQRSAGMAMRLFKRYIITVIRFLRHGKHISDDYRVRRGELTSIALWKSLWHPPS